MKKSISTKEMSCEQWQQERRQGIGGSDVAAILGQDQWKTPLDIYRQKVEGVQVEESFDMMMGKELEPVIAKIFTKDTGMNVYNDYKIRIHPQHEFLIANIDRRIESMNGSPGVLECKKTNKYVVQKWIDEGLPRTAYLQTLHYLAVTGYTWGEVAILIDANDFFHVHVERDEETIGIMTEQLIKFWNEHIIPQIPPEPVNSEDIAKLFPRSDPGKIIEASDETYKTIQILKDIKTRIKGLESEEDKLKEQIKLLMNDTEILKYGDENLITWKSSKDSESFDKKQFKEDNPAMYELYCQTIPGSRRFLVK